MDFVIFGLGYGASLMLLGWALRFFGPSLRYRYDEQTATDEQYDVQRRWVQFTEGLGAVVAVIGIIVVLVTVILLLMDANNDVGNATTLSLAGLGIVATLVWAWLFNSRFGLDGVATWRRDLDTAPVLATASSQWTDDEPFADDTDVDTADTYPNDSFDFGPIPDAAPYAPVPDDAAPHDDTDDLPADHAVPAPAAWHGTSTPSPRATIDPADDDDEASEEYRRLVERWQEESAAEPDPTDPLPEPPIDDEVDPRPGEADPHDPPLIPSSREEALRRLRSRREQGADPEA